MIEKLRELSNDDAIITTEVGQRLAAAIPEARLALIDDITYAPVPDLIQEFLAEGEEATAAASVSPPVQQQIKDTDGKEGEHSQHRLARRDRHVYH